MRFQKMDDDYLQTLEFVAFDTETTGLWAPVNRIVELGAVKFRLGSATVQQFQELVNPERKIPIETVQVHGITDGMVRDAETVGTVLKRFVDFVGPDSIMIAHNALFDISFVGCEMTRSDMPLIPNMILDTVELYQKYFPGLDSYSLLALAQQFHVSRSQTHRAADDAALVWKLFAQVAEKFPFMKTEGDLRREFTIHSMSQWQEEKQELPDQYADIDLAIRDALSMEIIYRASGRPPETRLIRPLRIHFLKNQFYVAAYCEQAKGERTFRLDRIRSFRLIRS
jgi:DNA polymerase-3 subunit epsilon